MKVNEIQAIDVHGHFGVYMQEGAGVKNELMTGQADIVVKRAEVARTCLTIASPLESLLPRGKSDPIHGNRIGMRAIESIDEMMLWVVVDPTKPQTYDQAAEMLQDPKCAGIKIHPEEHCYHIKEHGKAIFEFAAKHDAIVSTHSGEERSLPGDFVVFANEFSSVKLIIAHLGNGWDHDCTHQVRAIQQSKHGNLFTDTSSMQGLISGLLEWAVGQIGPERIMYGTDTPLYFAPMQRARVEYADPGI